jgi:hypothetical protein
VALPYETEADCTIRQPCTRWEWRAALEVRIFSARCFGV